MEEKKFQRTREDFTCEKCGVAVQGNGYTNHCPQCLWGKHVDIFPGDRREMCRGLMEPVAIEKKGKEYIVLHRCTECGFERKNKIADGDNFDTAKEITAKGYHV